MNHKYQLRKFLLTILSKDIFAYQFVKPKDEMPYAYTFDAWSGSNAPDGCNGGEGLHITGTTNSDGVMRFFVDFGCSFRPRYKARQLTKIDLYREVQKIINEKTTEEYCQRFMQNKTIYPSII